MSDVAIQAENLSKQYTIGTAIIRHDTLRDQLMDGLTSLFRRNGHAAPISDTIWALKDVSFEIKQGEVVGIIGRNGAGKSTLLKILSRITEPTTGRAKVYGRLASLLEVGTGFHGELTGRENIYLNGAILGMRKTEIDRKLDEIIAFAEIDRFIDTPVKRYSSGMYVRLAFAVAAHLEPEILIVDEVLAVGDSAFQRKCLGKMGSVAKEGRTVLFVSHNMPAVQSLCSRVILIHGGKCIANGNPHEIIHSYLTPLFVSDHSSLEDREDRAGDRSAKIVSLQIENEARDKVIQSTTCLKITLGYRSDKAIMHPRFLVCLYDYHSSAGLYLMDTEAADDFPEIIPQEGSVTCVTGPLNLTPGRCTVNVALFRGGLLADHVECAGNLDIESAMVPHLRRIPNRERVTGIINYKWQINESPGVSVGDRQALPLGENVNPK